MSRLLWGLVTAVWVTVAGLAWAADAPTGNYKYSLYIYDPEAGFKTNVNTLFLLKFDNKDGKLQAEVLAKPARMPQTTVKEATVKDGVLRVVLELKARAPVQLVFEGKVPADGKKITGSFSQGGNVLPAALESTALTSLDTFELQKEAIATATGPEVFEAAFALLTKAGEKKAKVDEVRTWASKAVKAAENYGPAWQREMTLQLVEILTQTEDYAPVAVQYARQAERLLQPTDKIAVQQRTLRLLGDALTKAGKADEAKEVTGRIDKIQAVTPVKFAGRKMGDRPVLVELFTGAECPPCVAADLAFDALGKTYQPKDVMLLQYHLHIPGPDPLTNTDTEARRSFYGDVIEGTPTIFFNGKAQDFGGGGYDDAQERYQEYTEALNPLLEKNARVKLKASAVRKGSKIDITAEASDVDEPGDKVRLRLALVEKEVNYKGGNRLAHHHHVVRALPGGAAGLPLKDKTGKQTATVDLDDLRKSLTKYLDNAAKDLDFPNKERPMELKNLSVVAFVQNDATKEVLQAVQVEVTEGK
ncbi:MAG: hypothetical protein JNM56_12605 [Planctomycetia bacterium]|nr:hypothetical protein [Planctomycetia bacterium]